MNTSLKAFIVFILVGISCLWFNEAKNGWVQDERKELVTAYRYDILEQAVVETTAILNDQIILLEKRLEGGIRQHNILSEGQIPEVLLTKLHKDFWNLSGREELQRVAVDALDTVIFFITYADSHGGKLNTQAIQYATSLLNTERLEGKQTRDTAKHRRMDLMKEINSNLEKAQWMTWERIPVHYLAQARMQGRLKWNH